MKIFKGKEPGRFEDNSPDYRLGKPALWKHFMARWEWDFKTYIESIPSVLGEFSHSNSEQMGKIRLFDFDPSVCNGLTFVTIEDKIVRHYTVNGDLIEEKESTPWIEPPDMWHGLNKD